LVASVAQLVEQQTLNLFVQGSSPCRGTTFSIWPGPTSCAAIPAGITSAQQPTWNAGSKIIVAARRTRRNGWGATLEVVAAVELAALDDARALEREMKRKKNPRLALALLHSRMQ
jgi:hypothetical protein